MLKRVRERIHPQELIQARAAAEAAPIPARPTRLPANWGRDMIAFLKAEAPVERPSEFFAALDARPIPHANWDAWLADDWAHINARWDNLADGTARVFARMAATYEFAPHAMVQPLLSEIAELTAVTLVNWRQELRVHAEAELALYGAKAVA